MTTAASLVKNYGTSSGQLLPLVNLSSGLTAAKERYRGIEGNSYGDQTDTSGVWNRYGFPELNIPGTLMLQATDWSKPVEITGRLNDATTVDQIQLYLRIYRELNYSSYSRDKKLEGQYKTSNITGYNQRAGSYGYGNLGAWKGQGLYQIWWIIWTGDDGTNGMLIDNCNFGVMKRAIDKNDFTGTPLSNGIEVFHDTGAFGLKIYEKDNVHYYIRDVAGVPPTKSTEQLAAKPKVIIASDLAGLTTNLRYVSTAREFDKEGTSPAGLMSGGQNAGLNLIWSPLDIQIEGIWYPIAVSGEDYERIKILVAAAKKPIQPTSLGGTSLIKSGPSANWVEPNLFLTSDLAKGSEKYWAPSLVSYGGDKKFVYPVVVGGEELSNLPGPYASGRDDKWTPSSSNPDDYWYVLPRVLRSKTSGCCKNIDISGTPPIQSASDAAAEFGAPSASCSYGKHWGKFLKSEFSQGDLTEWLNWIENSSKANAGTILSSNALTGWRRGSSSTYARGVLATMSSPVFKPFQFTLRGLPEFSGYYGGASYGSAGETFNDPIDKTITQKLNAALSSKKINEWTIDGITTFAKEQATALGKSLGEIKSELLQLFFNAKFQWYMADENKSELVAKSQAQNDPVYKALIGLFATITTPSTGSSGASSGTSGAAGGGSRGSSGSGQSTSGGNTGGNKGEQTKTIRINVTRGLPGYKAGIQQSAVTGDKPTLFQTYWVMDSPEPVVKQFEFPFVPREVNYSGLGAQWTEIERTGNFPVVDWTSFQLLKISFNFDVVDRTLENTTGFGLYWSCEDQIRTLREMAQAPYPVTFLNMDQFMSDEVRYPLFTRGRGIEFVIAEFTVASVQRTPSTSPLVSGRIVPNQISRATCSMTLQEIPIEAIDIVQMPRIKPCNNKNKKCEEIPTKKLENDRTYALFTGGAPRG